MGPPAPSLPKFLEIQALHVLKLKLHVVLPLAQVGWLALEVIKALKATKLNTPIPLLPTALNLQTNETQPPKSLLLLPEKLLELVPKQMGKATQQLIRYFLPSGRILMIVILSTGVCWRLLIWVSFYVQQIGVIYPGIRLT